MGIRNASRVLLALIVGAATLAGGVSHAAATCAGSTGGGDWSSYGHDLHNTRNQTEEHTIGVDNVATLKAAWGATSSSPGGLGGSFQSTPVIANGCVYVGTGRGSIMAFNADSGAAVWQVTESPVAALGGVFAPTVIGNTVYVTDGEAGLPYVEALDASTGALIWRTLLWQQALDGEPDYFGVNASMVAFDGLLFVPLVGSDVFDFSHPSFYILRQSDGAILKKTIVIPQSAWTNLYAGGGIWGTAVVDEATKYLYVGTTNPYNKRQEYPYTDAILKIDFDQNRDATFGEIVGHYKGDHDYTDADYYTTQCEALGEAIPAGYSTFCGQQDVDFGASPNLYTTADGRTVVSDLQKSCTFHAVDASSMQPIWLNRNPAFGGAGSCAGTSGYDDRAIYVGESDGFVHAFSKDDGTPLWTTQFQASGGHYQPITVANGVVYTLTNDARIVAFSAADGTTVLNKALDDGAGNACASTNGSGIAIARNTVYVECDSGSSQDGILYAYRLA